MTELLYLRDSYLKEFEAKVVSVNGKCVFLDRTAFYPTSGGQPNDTGTIECGEAEFRVLNVTKSPEGVCHEVDKEGLKRGDAVRGRIDWARRHRLMRSHTAAHVLTGVCFSRWGVRITGNQLGTERSRIDFNLENFNRDMAEDIVNTANALIESGKPVKMYWMRREDVMKDPELLKLADKLPPDIAEWRIVEIEGVERSADGGTHVADIKEIGRLELAGVENKGKNNRRIYFTLRL